MLKDAGGTSQEDLRESNDFIIDAAHTTTSKQAVNMLLFTCEEKEGASPDNNAGIPLVLMAIL
eukprot:2364511-Prorocentrum_lima.AAC.1